MWKTQVRITLAALLALMLAAPAAAQTREQAKRIYDRLAGVPPTESVLNAMVNNTGTDRVVDAGKLFAVMQQRIDQGAAAMTMCGMHQK